MKLQQQIFSKLWSNSSRSSSSSNSNSNNSSNNNSNDSNSASGSRAEQNTPEFCVEVDPCSPYPLFFNFPEAFEAEVTHSFQASFMWDPVTGLKKKVPFQETNQSFSSLSACLCRGRSPQ